MHHYADAHMWVDVRHYADAHLWIDVRHYADAYLWIDVRHLQLSVCVSASSRSHGAQWGKRHHGVLCVAQKER